MPNQLSPLGIFHTIISILALLVALSALSRKGKIEPTNLQGRLYIWLTVITCITGFPIMKTGHLTPGHYLAIIILVLLPLAIYAKRLFGKAAIYVQTAFLSTTVFLSFIPALVETFTRIPPAHPLAYGPADPLIQKALSGIFLIFIVGTAYQLVRLRSGKANN